MLSRRNATAIEPWVFAWPDGMRLKTFLHVWRRACKVNGCPRLLVHELRRSFVRVGMLAKVRVKTVMDAGGWRSLRMVHRCGVVDEGMLPDGLLASRSRSRPRGRRCEARRARNGMESVGEKGFIPEAFVQGAQPRAV